MGELAHVVEGDAAPIRWVKGSKQRIVPFARDASREADEEGVGHFEFRLVRVGLNEPKQIAQWSGIAASRQPNDWADDVLDQAKDHTEGAGTRCEFVLEAVIADQVRKQYRIVTQPMNENLMPSAEGLVHLAMRQQSAAVNALLTERAAVTDGYRQTIQFLKDEIERQRQTIREYQARENGYREREMKLLDRESALRLTEINSIATLNEKQDERIDRIGERVIEALETVGVDAAKTAVERLEPGDVRALLEKYGPLMAKMMGGN